MEDRHDKDGLTFGEQTILACLENVIGKGIKAVPDAGEALLAVREKRLYRKAHTSFDAYCRKRWGLSKRRMEQYINAARGREERRGTT